jgi:maltose/maltodextrin transport system substrate-binding protein/arabinogalactan oligomer/maltooligosaccharide transport system substrate-binding protein
MHRSFLGMPCDLPANQSFSRGEDVMRNKSKPVLSIIIFTLLLSIFITSCAPQATVAPTTVSVEPTAVVEQPTTPPTKAPTKAPTTAPTETVAAPVATLKIWADDTRAPILQAFAADFKAKYNVELVVEDLGRVQDIRTPMITAAPAGEGPDIFIGVHDWLGALIESGLVAPIDLGDKKSEFVQSALDAFTYTDGKLYGVPYATENLGFFYNTDLVPTPPTTWAEVLEIGRTLKATGKIQYAFAMAGGGYENMPVLTANGGYIFGLDANGAWNPNDVGLDSPGMIAGVKYLADAAKEGLIPATADYETAHSLFETGQTAFLMAGPWALDRIRASGVPYKVTSFPDNGVPFLGVQGFMVNAFSENVLLAQTFLTEYVSTPEFMQKIYETGLRPSAFKSVLATTTDPDLAAMGEAGVNAMPMPNIPAMGSVWTAWNNGIALATAGTQTPEAAMKDAAAQVRALIAGALAGMVNLPGSYQDKAGCGGTWDPACEATAMKKGDNGLYTLTVKIPAGDYEFKVALDGAWTVNYGSDGAQDGPNYPLKLTADGTVTFTYNPDTHLVEVTIQ